MHYNEIALRAPVEIASDAAVIVYCWSPGCNAGAKGALEFATLGYDVREMIGGFEYWVREGKGIPSRMPMGCTDALSMPSPASHASALAPEPRVRLFRTVFAGLHAERPRNDPGAFCDARDQRAKLPR